MENKADIILVFLLFVILTIPNFIDYVFFKIKFILQATAENWDGLINEILY